MRKFEERHAEERNQLAYLRNALNLVEKFAKQTLDKAELHIEDIYSSDSDEFANVKGIVAKGGIAAMLAEKERSKKDEDRKLEATAEKVEERPQACIPAECR